MVCHPFLFLSTFPLYITFLTVRNNHSIHRHKHGLVGWPYAVLLQVTSPTPLLSLVQRLLSFSSHDGEQVLAQCTILVRTPQLHLCPSRSDEQPLDPRTARRSGRSTIQHSLTLPRSSLLVAMYSRKRKSCRDPNVIKESYSVKERIFAERREIRDFLNCKVRFKPHMENRQLQKKSLKRNMIRDCSLKDKRIIYCLRHDLR